MPLLRVTATPRAFDDAARTRFVSALTEAAWQAESIPDDPLARARAVVIWDQISEGCVWWGSRTADDVIRAVFISFTVSDGVLDPIRRDRFTAAVHAAATEAIADEDERVLHTSVIFNEVPEGRWGRDGKVLRLPEMVAHAGFEHLTGLLTP